MASEEVAANTDGSSRHELTAPLDSWTVVLRTGQKLTIWAHGVRTAEGSNLVFAALMRGDPNYEVVIAEVPKEAVEDFFGG